MSRWPLALAVLLLPTLVSAQETRMFGSFRATTSIAFSAAATSERHAAIAWRCMADGLNVIYLVGNAVGREIDREVAIASAVDQHEHEPQRWLLLEGHQAAFLPRASVEAFTTEALAAERLSLRLVDPATGRAFADEFMLDGLRSALQYILPCQF